MTTLDARFLKRKTRPPSEADENPLRTVDLFAGCGGLSVGLAEAARRAGRGSRVELAVDVDPVMATTFRANVASSRVLTSDVSSLFPGDPGSRLQPDEERLRQAIGDVAFLCGGPPCQGHSDLNNHTRRTDARNRLYLRMGRAAEVLRPTVVIIENVPAVAHDTEGVVDETVEHLEKLGYRIAVRVVDLSAVGVPQGRRRHLVIATNLEDEDPEAALDFVASFGSPRTVEWAIADLDGTESDDPFDRPSNPTDENRRRMAYLHRRDEHDLPDHLRPPCHRDKPHTYKAVYGRMWWDRPAPTITTGFGSMGQGRFVHPGSPRTITPHEAARLQTFPDWFDWGKDTGRGRLATMIGNAVPPLLTVRLGEYWIPRLPTR